MERRRLPPCWTASCLPTGRCPVSERRAPARFLADGDVFVYFTHPDWVESFGRVIFEAMAVGLPVILPRVYEPLFKDAAIYAEPDEVLAKVDALMADDALYEAQVARALAYVNDRFSYRVHAERIAPEIRRPLTLDDAHGVVGGTDASIVLDSAGLASFDAGELGKLATALGKGGRTVLSLVLAASWWRRLTRRWSADPIRWWTRPACRPAATSMITGTLPPIGIPIPTKTYV